MKVEDVQLSMDDLQMILRWKCCPASEAQMNFQESGPKQIVQELKINQATQSPHIVLCHQSFYHNAVIYLVPDDQNFVQVGTIDSVMGLPHREADQGIPFRAIATTLRTETDW